LGNANGRVEADIDRGALHGQVTQLVAVRFVPVVEACGVSSKVNVG